jgi:hypothetical protein
MTVTVQRIFRRAPKIVVPILLFAALVATPRAA